MSTKEPRKTITAELSYFDRRFFKPGMVIKVKDGYVSGPFTPSEHFEGTTTVQAVGPMVDGDNQPYISLPPVDGEFYSRLLRSNSIVEIFEDDYNRRCPITVCPHCCPNTNGGCAPCMVSQSVAVG